MTEFNLKIPLENKDVEQLKIGDLVYFTGEAWTCRSRLQKYVFDEGHNLPFSIKKRNMLIHVGPVIIKADNDWKITAFTLTSSHRFEKWGPRATKDWGLKAIVGKTTMGKSTMNAMKEYKCIHATPIGVTPNLYLEKIRVKDVYLFDEFGSIEAAWVLEIRELGPFLVDIDCKGSNYFDDLDIVIDKNREKAYQVLGIRQDFEYTKLY